MLKQQAPNQSTIRKKSVQPSGEFRQHESTMQKNERTLNTNEQQTLNQTANMPNGSENKGLSKKQMKLRRQFVEPSEEFREQKSTIQKNERTLNTSEQQKLNQTATTLSDTENKSLKKNNFNKQFVLSDGNISGDKNNQTLNAGKFQKADQTEKFHKHGSKFKEKKSKLQKSSSLGKETLESGIEKYQDELEKDDEGVKLTSKSIRKVYKLSTKSLEKLKKKPLQKRNFKKDKDNAFRKEKQTKSSLKKITKIPASGLQKGSQKYQDELQKDDEGVKLVSESASKISKTSKKLYKASILNSKSGKLNKQKSKLMQSSNKNNKLDIQTKAILKKKNNKKRLYAPYRSKKSSLKTGFTSNVFNRITSYFKSNVLKVSQVAKVIMSKYIALFGGGLSALIPIFLVAIICLVVAGIIGAGTSTSEDNYANIGVSKNLSPNVERWRGIVEKEARAQGMESYVSLILAIIQVETGGTGNDVMQSSESAGLPVNSLNSEASIRQGIKHLKGIVKVLKGFGKGYENNTKLLAQAYNFGTAFANYVGKRGGEYTLEVAEEYSKNVVAPSLGNYSGATVPYINETSLRLGKTYRYVNGGNFLYGELVSEYIGGARNVTGEFQKILNEVEKYQGWPYVWGGKNPSTGFDCSGLVSWGLKQIGISLPSYAATQYQLTTPVSESEAKPGDLIFFKGTYGGANHISHVGFYVNRNTMYDSNGSGVGYHNWKDPYWQAHFAGIHRVK